MSAKSLALMIALGVLALSGGAALAQSTQTPAAGAVNQGRPPTALQRRAAHPHIEINPRPLLYRRCQSWYVLQHRPSGTVLFPQQHCWWVRG